jgi:hypothetical protein
MKTRVIIKREYGDVEIEGDSLDELIEGLESFPEWLAIIDRLVMGPEEREETRSLEGLIEITSEGPSVIVPRDELSSKEAIGLILYAIDPDPMEPKEIGRLLKISGQPSAGYGSRLSEMKREGIVVKEDNAYRLSVAGRNWVEEVGRRIRG